MIKRGDLFRFFAKKLNHENEPMRVQLYPHTHKEGYQWGDFYMTGYHTGTFSVGQKILITSQYREIGVFRVEEIRFQFADSGKAKFNEPMQRAEEGWKHWVKLDRPIDSDLFKIYTR